MKIIATKHDRSRRESRKSQERDGLKIESLATLSVGVIINSHTSVT